MTGRDCDRRGRTRIRIRRPRMGSDTVSDPRDTRDPAGSKKPSLADLSSEVTRTALTCPGCGRSLPSRCSGGQRFPSYRAPAFFVRIAALVLERSRSYAPDPVGGIDVVALLRASCRANPGHDHRRSQRFHRRRGARRHGHRGEQGDQRHPDDLDQRGRPVRLSGVAAGHLHREERARGVQDGEPRPRTAGAADGARQLHARVGHASPKWRPSPASRRWSKPRMRPSAPSSRTGASSNCRSTAETISSWSR